MIRTRSVRAALVALLAVSAGAPPAIAAVQDVDDPAGDGARGIDMDITSLHVRNGDRRIRVVVTVGNVSQGDFAVRFQARGVMHERRAVVYSEWDGKVAPSQMFATDKKQSCDGVRVTWDEDKDRLIASFPVHCWRHGDIGAIRAHAITEDDGIDTDLAPKRSDGSWGWTPWVARG